MAKSINETFIEMEQNKDLMKELWDTWHISKTACYGAKLLTYERMLYTSKWMNKKYPEISKMAFYKYLDRNIN
jgi:hypothetical protein